MRIDPEFIVVDLFCGAGGTTTGFDMAFSSGNKIAYVAACVNHDPLAIKSHWINHPDVEHFEEDITKLYGHVTNGVFFQTDQMIRLVRLVNIYRALYPAAKVILWASLECTNFSKAKGGKAREADSRTLANHLDRYVYAIDPDYIQIENVVEFRSWGPLDEKGKPESKKNGRDWIRWKQHLCTFGYRDDWNELNSANFGAYTSRNRLFGIFAKPGLNIVWPQPTHSKKPSNNGMFGDLKKWKAVKEVLDFEDEGISIFNRKKPLVDASLERIYAGLVKFVAGGKDAFILKYNSMGKNGDRTQSAMSVDSPSPVISCQNRTGLCFIAKYYSGKPAGKVIPVTGPAGTIATAGTQSLVNVKPFIVTTNFKGVGRSVEEPAPTLMASRKNQYVVQPSFLTKYHGTGENCNSVEDPASTLSTKDRLAKVQTVWFDKTFTGTGNVSSIENPAGVIMPTDKHRLIVCDPFILNPSHGGNTMSVDVPCGVIIARQDKAPLYLIQFKIDPEFSIPIYDCDTEVMIRIKIFMSIYGIADIKMRMLKVLELLKIQGFPSHYKLAGNQSDQKKFIGNSVVPHVVRAWTEAMFVGSRSLLFAA